VERRCIGLGKGVDHPKKVKKRERKSVVHREGKRVKFFTFSIKEENR
jgi:hypothetical protein